MKKQGKVKKLVFIVYVVLFLCANTIDVKCAKKNITTWDCIWFGKYPQTEIKDYKADGLTEYTAVDFKEQVWDLVDHDYKSRRYYANVNYNGENVYSLELRNYVIHFNDYPGEGAFDGKSSVHWFKYEPIKWRILKKEDDKMLLLSDKIIDQYYMYPSMSYMAGKILYSVESPEDDIWGKSLLRSYMNNEMYNMAFSEKEKEAIIDSEVKVSSYYMAEKDSTTDKLFILSYDQLTKEYAFNTEKSLKCEMSDLGRISGIYKYEKCGKFGIYYLLTDLRYHGRPANRISYSDMIDEKGEIVEDKDALHCNGIRVAMWVDTSKISYRSAGTVSSDGTVYEVLYEPVKKPKRVIIKKASKKTINSKKMKISLSKIKKIKGYQVAIYKEVKSAKKNKNALIKKFYKKTKIAISSKKIKNVAKLYVKARAYKLNINKRVYGKWSKIKKVKIK